MIKRTPILVSACLGGLPCRYDGKSQLHPEIMELVATGLAIPICPEQLGGLPTPRSAAEIVGGDGNDVLAGMARVMTVAGDDVTGQFVRGAEAVAGLAQLCGAELAVLQERSPSCGLNQVYDGSFSRRLCPGQGVTAAKLTQLGLEVRVASRWQNRD